MQRSASVSGNRPIAAITFGHQHENLASLLPLSLNVER